MEQIASFVAPIATTIAALVVASNLGARMTGYGFIIFSVGSVCWAALGLTTDQPNLLWQNVILTGLNLFGVWRWLGRQAKVEDGAQAAAEASEETPGESLFPASLLSRAKMRCGGTDVGTCVDAMAGCGSGLIAYVVVSEGGVAGVGERLRRVPWDQVHVDRETLVANFGAERFATLEELPKDQWPAR